MERNEFIELVDKKIKLIRTEKNITQDKMAEILGISKKTLIQIEKGRSSLGWTCAVAVCTIFKESEILDAAFGGDVTFIIQSLAFNNYNIEYGKTMGGKIWWKDIDEKDGYKIQQNIISNHYRILDSDDRRICSTFDYQYIEMRFKEL
ncbi:MAG: helix-turn-helix transcriptional regulator [Clostridiaceae bacterium]|nr:helix-turn-helix transcriptional regulator [Clostridiaceae bacterium]